MSHLSKEEILRELTRLFNEASIQKFTLLLQQTPLPVEQQDYQYHYQVEQLSKPTNRIKSASLADKNKYYKHSISVRKNTNHNEDSRFYGESRSIVDFEEISETPKSIALDLYRDGQIAEATEIFEELKNAIP